ncbi:MAG: ribokinase [Chloroflexi bacterium]|nr:ribokinase [Chloroflexota bacterium]
MAHIVVVGSANTDMVLRCDRLPRAGETVLGGDFTMAQGGKGANQAVAVARLGMPITFVTRLGRDTMGNRAEASYLNEGIQCDYISRDDTAASGVALIMVDASGENLIGVAPGANGTLAPEHIAQAESAMRAANVLLVQLEIPLDTVRAAVQLACKWNTRVILNPAPARDLPSDLIADVILTPNEHELAQITGIAEAELAAKHLIAQGARAVIVTLGERGALLVTAMQARRIPSFPVNVVDTTAAGDAFNGGLAVALARGDDLPDAVRYASAVGALAVTQFGAQPSLPTAAQVAKLLSEASAAQ